MTSDARDSVRALVTVGAFFGFTWAALHYGWLDGLSNTWVGIVGGALTATNLVWFVRGIWQRRAANPNNPNVR